MGSCPNCRATVDGAATDCPQCGVSLTGGTGTEQATGGQQGQGGQGRPQQGQGGQGRPQGGQGGQGRPQGGQGGQGRPQGGQGGQGRPQGGQGGQGRPQRGQQYQGQGGQGQHRQVQPQQGPPPQGYQGQRGGGSGISRRPLLAGGGAVGLAAVGFFVFTEVLEGGGPAGTVRSFFQAVDKGNTQHAEDLIHPASPDAGTLTQEMSQAQAMDISVSNTEVVEQTEQEATVEATIAIGSGDFSRESTATFVLRKHEGEWLLYSSR